MYQQLTKILIIYSQIVIKVKIVLEDSTNKPSKWHQRDSKHKIKETDQTLFSHLWIVNPWKLSHLFKKSKKIKSKLVVLLFQVKKKKNISNRSRSVIKYPIREVEHILCVEIQWKKRIGDKTCRLQYYDKCYRQIEIKRSYWDDYIIFFEINNHGLW